MRSFHKEVADYVYAHTEDTYNNVGTRFRLSQMQVSRTVRKAGRRFLNFLTLKWVEARATEIHRIQRG
jgi:hypothetical protein